MSTWEAVSGELEPDEHTTLDTLLVTLLSDDKSVGTAVGYSDEQRSATTLVFNVSILPPLVVGVVYQHPGRFVIATRPYTAPPAPEPTAGDEFDALLAGYAESL